MEGLKATSATRAGFLAETSCILTPAVSYAAGFAVPRQVRCTAHSRRVAARSRRPQGAKLCGLG
jgi:hypothetical protein